MSCCQDDVMQSQETKKDPEVEGSRSYQSSVTPVTVFRSKQRGADDPFC